MSFTEKNITVTLVSFSLILVIFVSGIMNMLAGGGLNATSLFWLWGVVIIMAIVFTIISMILTHIITAIIEAIRQGTDDPQIEDLEDERDKLIDLRGTKLTYFVSSLGVFLAMLSYVIGRDPLVMFSLLILVGLVAQIAGDIARLVMYRRGF